MWRKVVSAVKWLWKASFACYTAMILFGVVFWAVVWVCGSYQLHHLLSWDEMVAWMDKR